MTKLNNNIENNKVPRTNKAIKHDVVSDMVPINICKIL